MRHSWSIKLLILAFAVYLGLLGADLFIRPDVVFSEQENRYMELRPVFTWQDLVSGRYGRQLELWMTDQIAGRDQWVGYKAELMRLIGFKENRGIYFGRDQYLIQKFSRPAEDELQEVIQGILHLQQLLPDIPVIFLLAPTSAAIYPDKLPKLATTDDQTAFIEAVRASLSDAVTFVDVLLALQQKSNEAIYFKTDHHWTMRGAFYAWQSWQHQSGQPVPSFEDYQIEHVTQSFFGTSFSRAGLYRLQPDMIEVFRPNQAVPVKVSFGNSDKIRDSLYNETFLSKKDKYSYFLDGNHPLLVIRTERPDRMTDDRRIMVIKNSYANCLIPFLTRDYDEIHVIDLRFNQSNLAQYARDNAIDEILYLYDVIGFGNDRLLRLLSKTTAP
ncbi:MAG: DHHW family protein [Bacillota bacterium]|nr:DHHW family protein [Bacillota bacterium]